MSDRRYWVFRIDTNHIDALRRELDAGRLRQGWGWDEGQDLRELTVDEGAGRNIRMFKEVKKDDLLLVPHLPAYGRVTIVRATQDWDQGYDFGILKQTKDHGHIFPAERVKVFNRNHQAVPAAIRQTLRTPSRFWSIDHLGEYVVSIVNAAESLTDESTAVERWNQIVLDCVRESDLERRISDAVNRFFQSSEWEDVLREALQILYPTWTVERVAGRAEAVHGADLLMTAPSPVNGYYGIAIQVKDHVGELGTFAVDQVSLSRGDYWKDETVQIIDCIVAVTGGQVEGNGDFSDYAKKQGVSVLWSHDINNLLLRASTRIYGDLMRESSDG